MENEKVNNQHERNLKRISSFLDSKFTGPFGIKFGLDPILGLIPGIGDVVTTLLSLYIIFHAYLMGVGPFVLTRMLVNILLENLVDMIPILGNIFDFVWRANNKNLELLEKYKESPQKQRFISQVFILSIFIFFLFLLGFSFYASFSFLKALTTYFSS
jgi:hypothetical protein